MPLRFVLMFCFWLAVLPAVAQKLDRSEFEQSANTVLIHFYMSGVTETQRFDVRILCSDNGGTSYNITPKTISGTGNGIALKNGKNTAAWDVLKDRATLDGTNFTFKTEVALSFLPEMVFVKGGKFNMGSNDGNSDEKPVHEVTLTDFYMGKYEVTIGEYLKFCAETKGNYPVWLDEKSEYYINGGTNDTYKKVGMSETNLRHPVTGVSWDNAVAYCQWLSKKNGQTYRLPTEAEWEYAAGGGQNTPLPKTASGLITLQKWAGTDSENMLKEYAWYDANANSATHEAGTRKPNPLGIYDLSGNVWEWCTDKWHSTYDNAPKTGTSWEDGTSSDRVSRGGSWGSILGHCRVARRGYGTPTYRSYSLGFRLVRSL